MQNIKKEDCIDDNSKESKYDDYDICNKDFFYYPNRRGAVDENFCYDFENDPIEKILEKINNTKL